MEKKLYNEAILQAVNGLGKDFRGLWKKNVKRLKEAGAASAGLLLAEELLRHVTDKLWLMRRELDQPEKQE
ncbi:MAG: hypothetical protein FWE85_04270 [Clostridiales bacterium]|nr:hypothetical protein [Clostridiales bacterium]